MQILEILNYAFPYTPEDLRCKIKMQKKKLQRERLKEMIEAYKNGEIIKFDPLCVSIDIDELMKRFEN